MNTQLTMGPAPSTATIKALTLHQPWGTAMALGLKACETRSWSTGYRGLLAIHAGKVLDLSRRPGRFAWVTRPVVWFREPFTVAGHQGLWGWDPPAGWRTR